MTNSYIQNMKCTQSDSKLITKDIFISSLTTNILFANLVVVDSDMGGREEEHNLEN